MNPAEFYCEWENTDEKRDAGGYVTETNVLKVFRSCDKSSVATLEHRSKPFWFKQYSYSSHTNVQYVLCPYHRSAVAGKSEEWKNKWFKSFIVNCETGTLIETPIVCQQRGFYGFELSEDGRFLLSNTYSGYENFVSLYNLEELDHSKVTLARVLPTHFLPQWDYNKHKEIWYFDDNNCGKIIKKPEPSNFLFVPEVKFVKWDSTVSNVVGFSVTTTCGYVFKDEFAFTVPTYRNLHKDWMLTEKTVQAEFATARFVFNQDSNCFEQTAFKKCKYSDMPMTDFEDIFNKAGAEETTVDYWGKENE